MFPTRGSRWDLAATGSHSVISRRRLSGMVYWADEIVMRSCSASNGLSANATGPALWWELLSTKRALGFQLTPIIALTLRDQRFPSRRIDERVNASAMRKPRQFLRRRELPSVGCKPDVTGQGFQPRPRGLVVRHDTRVRRSVEQPRPIHDRSAAEKHHVVRLAFFADAEG